MTPHLDPFGLNPRPDVTRGWVEVQTDQVSPLIGFGLGLNIPHSRSFIHGDECYVEAGLEYPLVIMLVKPQAREEETQ